MRGKSPLRNPLEPSFCKQKMHISFYSAWQSQTPKINAYEYINIKNFPKLTRTFHYRPQRSCGKMIFSQASVSHSVHGGGVSATHPPSRHPPSRHPSYPVHAGIHTPPAQCMLGYTPFLRSVKEQVRFPQMSRFYCIEHMTQIQCRIWYPNINERFIPSTRTIG